MPQSAKETPLTPPTPTPPAAPRQPKNQKHSEKSKIVPKKKALITQPNEFIPLGRNHIPGPSKNERSASFKLTPEAMKAINARKVAATTTSTPTPKPMRKPPKRPAHNENDPTQKKRLRISRPAAPTVVVKEVEPKEVVTIGNS